MGCSASKTDNAAQLPPADIIIMQNTPWAPSQKGASKFVCVTVDDEPTIRASLDTKLRDHPLVEAVHPLDDGKGLTEFIRDNVMDGWSAGNPLTPHPPPVRCIVFLDIILVTKNGTVRCKELRKAFGHAVCIIASTANVGDHSLTTYKQSGFDGVLSKLFTTKAVNILLRHVNNTPHLWIVQV